MIIIILLINSSIKLKSKPNIYLIGFDSMTSKSWQKKYFGYEESYIETLDKYYESYSDLIYTCQLFML